MLAVPAALSDGTAAQAAAVAAKSRYKVKNRKIAAKNGRRGKKLGYVEGIFGNRLTG